MTLPLSGTITMGMVKTELGIASGTTVNMQGLNVKSLFDLVLGPGTVNLTNGYGKALWVRPTGATYTGTTPTNPTYAYDTTGITVDTTTSATLTTTVTVTSTQIYSFAAGTNSKTLHVALSSISVDNVNSSDLSNTAISSVLVEVSINGSTYGQTFDQTSYWNGATLGAWSTTNLTLTKVLSSQNMSLLRVRITTVSQRLGAGATLAVAAVTCNVSDIVVVV